jgi:hypothetical protein
MLADILRDWPGGGSAFQCHVGTLAFPTQAGVMGDSQAGGISKLLQAETLAQEIVNRARKGSPSPPVQRGRVHPNERFGLHRSAPSRLSWRRMATTKRRRPAVEAALGYPRRRGACSNSGA